MAKRSASLGDRLILSRYILSLLGFSSFEEIQSLGLRGGFDDDMESFVFHMIKGRPGLKIPKDRLRTYDSNIYEYVSKISSARGENFTLTYFQYFAVLSVEIYLDRFFGNKNEFLKELNAFGETLLAEWKISAKDLEKWQFTITDLGKLAVYSATGSGKTLIQHINYLQYLRYHKGKIKGQSILITPNENLSIQHVEEFQKSGISAERLDTGSVSLGQSSLLSEKDGISVIEITKLKKEKKGEGSSVDVAAFEGDNLVFIDEAHKGITSGKEWKELRDTVGKTGFIFEYSATFGQAVSDETFVEYAKSIVFDYSYKFFYDDGYGKDYEILNLKNQAADPRTFRLFMTGNLLAFYEQVLLYDNEPELMREHGIERPLWVFVGQSVNKEDADVLKIIRFFRDFLEDSETSISHLRSILTSATGFVSADGTDVFSQKYTYLKSLGFEIEKLYAKIVSSVFQTSVGATLRFSDVKDAQGEIGLRASDGAYFGLVNVGETKKLLDNLENELERAKETDNFHKSLFRDIDAEASPVSILIGSKKFSEGWNSYRVSSMGLLNMGKGEGSQIIQLFGRGVRLRGKSGCLKRTSAIGGTLHPHIHIVETLNVFGVEADYMEKFRDYLEKEGLPEKPTLIPVEFPVNLRFNPISALKLKTIAIRYDKKFSDEAPFFFDIQQFPELHVELDLVAKVDAIASSNSQASTSAYRSDRKKIPGHVFGYLDLEKLYFEAVSHKRIKSFSNLLITPESIRSLFSAEAPEWYSIYAPENFPKGSSFDEIRVFQDYATILLKKYITAFYKEKREEWEKGFRELRPLSENDKSLLPDGYIVRVPADNRNGLFSAIEEAKKSGFLPEISPFKHIDFEGHLYEPLFTETTDVEYSPVALNSGERKFVSDLSEFCSDVDEKEKHLKGRKVFLLRNLTKAQGGVSFFEANNFSPDFILWICEGNRQSIAFLDPKGIRQLKAFTDPKILFSEEIKKIETELGDSEVKLHSYILSDTPYSSVHWKEGRTKTDFENAGVFFQEDPDYVKKVIKRMVASFSS